VALFRSRHAQKIDTQHAADVTAADADEYELHNEDDITLPIRFLSVSDLSLRTSDARAWLTYRSIDCSPRRFT
jgi:hypothetical protein